MMTSQHAESLPLCSPLRKPLHDFVLAGPQCTGCFGPALSSQFRSVECGGFVRPTWKSTSPASRLLPRPARYRTPLDLVRKDRHGTKGKR